MTDEQAVKDEIKALGDAVTAYEAQVAAFEATQQATLDTLNAKVAELQALVDAGHPADFQSMFDALEAIKATIPGAVPSSSSSDSTGSGAIGG